MNKKNSKHPLAYVVLVIFSIFTLIPFFLVIITSLKNMNDIIVNGPLSMPRIIRWENYIKIWKIGNMVPYLKNSIIVTIICILCILLLSLLASYAFAYLKFKGKGFFLTLILLGLMIPTELIIIPLFYNMKALGLLNSLWSIILPQIGMIIPFAIVVLRGFMRDLPVALLESARMDGSTEFKNLIYIIIPIVRPAMVSVIVFASIWTWNEFMLPTILIQDDAKRTLPVGLNYFRGKYSMDFSMTATAANISALPTILVFLVFQRKFFAGITAGALKG